MEKKERLFECHINDTWIKQLAATCVKEGLDIRDELKKHRQKEVTEDGVTKIFYGPTETQQPT